MKSVMFAVVMAMAVGCSAEQAGPSEGARALGIASFAITETDTRLTIEGLDARGARVGSVDLTVGRFTMTVDERGTVDGRQMIITVAGKYTTHESEGRTPLALPMHREPAIAAFLGDDQVASALARWDVGFEASQPAPIAVPDALTEQAYAPDCGDGWQRSVSSNPYSGCTSCTFAAGANCGSNTCRQFTKTGNEKGQFLCCNGSYNFVERACTTPWSTSTCGATGGGGCAVCWSDPRTGAFCAVGGSGGYCTGNYCSAL